MNEIKGCFYDITKEAEDRKFAEIRQAAKDKVEATRMDVQTLKAELNELAEVYDPDEKEGLAQWFNKDARFSQVRQELLRSERALRKPYFGRIDIVDDTDKKKETFYIGRSAIAKDPSRPLVIDWRAPVAGVYYDNAVGPCKYKVPGSGIFDVELKRKRTYEIENGELKDFYDSDVIANDDLLTKYLSRSRKAVLSEIIATIQKEQNNVIRKNPKHNVLIQGSAGSGKTTVAMHRISYILYNYPIEFKPEGFYIVGSNSVLLNYITGVLPDLDVYGVSQMTMETLFTRLLYEDWDKDKIIRKTDKSDKGSSIKGTTEWFNRLKDFCEKYEYENVNMEDVVLERTGRCILKGSEIKAEFARLKDSTLKDKFDRLTDILMSHLETEMYGRLHSYPEEVQKLLKLKYRKYFYRQAVKTSSLELYEQFIAEEKSKNPDITFIPGEYDLYDLAASAYIYKRLKETEVIQEASHVIVDEAQDFGIMIYRSLKYCMSMCTFTIMGDVAQNININSGLTDWEELKKLMLPDKFDYFGLLRKSYRNTVEVSQFATKILRRASFPIYPVEPVLRHGDEVFVSELDSESEHFNQVLERIRLYKEKEYETISVICKDNEEAENVYNRLSEYMEVSRFSEDDYSFKNGISVVPIEYAKGLEFDAVIIYDANSSKYPKQDGYARLLYVASTRALHELSVFSLGKMSGLLADSISQERLEMKFEMDDYHELPYEFEEEFITTEEAAKRQAIIGDNEMRQRLKYGPKRIVINSKPTEDKPVKKTPKPSIKPIGVIVPKPVETENKLTGPNTKRSDSGKKLSLYGTAMEGSSLQPIGHSKINTSVLWVNRTKDLVDITSSYGILRIEPVSDDTVFIAFAKDGHLQRGQHPEEVIVSKSDWKLIESKDLVEVRLKRLTVRVDKKSGAMSFVNQKGEIFLKERSEAPRQFHGNKDQWWEYFEFSKKEILTARGNEDWDWQDFSKAARYISACDGKGRTSIIMSNTGYQILVAPEIKAFLCMVPAFGPYLMFEDSGEICYYIRTAK